MSGDAARGLVTAIQRFSLHDGPGIRTAVFLKGCGMSCAWCHNPEAVSAENEVLFYAGDCLACGACAAACPNGAHRVDGGRHAFDRSRCSGCGACVEACWPGALRMAASSMSAAEVANEVGLDADYYRESGGGVTLSGGEALLQEEFSAGILERCAAEGIHSAVETGLLVPPGSVERLAPLVGLFMVDLKVPDADEHLRWTGAELPAVEGNLRLLERLGKRVILRTPIVPGVNDSPGIVSRIAHFAASLENVERYELLTFNTLGACKYEALGRPYAFARAAIPSRAAMRALAEAASRQFASVAVA